jgi:DNA modification methylase
VKADFGEWDKWDKQEDYLDFVFQVCKEYRRILKPNASMALFFSYRYAGWIAYELERQ